MAMLTIPANENGIVLDPALNPIVSLAVASDPFGFEDIFLYSHGWLTNADSASVDYDVFSIGLTRRLMQVQKASGALPKAPKPTLELGIHWPSAITENPNSPLADLDLFTFYTMEHRADAVGKNLVYSLLRMALKARGTQALRFILMGHSFGCKVVCAALQDIYTDIQNNTIPLDAETHWRVVLLEPATDWDNLQETDIYGNIGKFENLRILMTTSQLDRALTTWYPDASRIANLFHGGDPTPALGSAGPTPATIAYFVPAGNASRVDVTSGFDFPQSLQLNAKLVVANLTPVHQARANSGAYSGGIAGSHSDIFFDEMYNLVGGFIYQ